MKILVNATALDKRGGYSVIYGFLEEMSTIEQKLQNANIHLEVLVAKKDLERFSIGNIQVKEEVYPKKNLVSKWLFERKILPPYLKKNQFDAYLSLQNIGLRNIDIPQFVLIHQPLPFSKLLPREIDGKNYLKYNLLMHLLYKRTIANYSAIFVQTQWIKDAIRKKYKYEKPIMVYKPHLKDITSNNVPLPPLTQALFQTEKTKLLYVTSQEKYKNNKRLIKAVEEYNRLYPDKQVILFLTLQGEDTQFVRYINRISYESIYSLYKMVDALIFPSLAETLGLPPIEAMQAGKDVLIADLPYAHEVCGNNAHYFNPRDLSAIRESIRTYVNDENPQINANYSVARSDNYLEYIKYIYKYINGKTLTL